MPFHGSRVARVEQRLERREIVLEIVDGAIGISWRRPREACSGFLRGFRREHAVIRHAPRDGPNDVERVERRHPRTRLGDVEPRIRKIDALARRADRQLQQQPLGIPPLLLLDQIPVQRAAPLVEQQRIFARPLRHDAFSEARYEDDAEAAAAGLMWRADEQPAVASRRWVPVERREPVVQDVARFFARDRTDVRHRPEVGERLEHTRGTT